MKRTQSLITALAIVALSVAPAFAKGSDWRCVGGAVSAQIGTATAARVAGTGNVKITRLSANTANGWRLLANEIRRGPAPSVEAQWQKGTTRVKWEAEWNNGRIKQKTCTRTR